MRPVILVRGIGDMGSAIAHALFTAGYRVVIHDVAAPSAARRGMAFADAMFDGGCELTGVVAKRAESLTALQQLITSGEVVAATALELPNLLGCLECTALVDARMRKRAILECQRNLAPLTIGLGPNFVAGETVHVAIETSWDGAGAVVRSGTTKPLSGEPRPITGVGRERFVYAPGDGLFRTGKQIGDLVDSGAEVGTLGGVPLHAPLSGILRGLTHDDVLVQKGSKVIEIDPRGDRALVFGIGERPRVVAEGVLAALRSFSAIPRAAD